MNEYEQKTYEEVELWKNRMKKRSSVFNRLSKKAQIKVNNLIPEKVHTILTESIKNMVKATLVGSNLTTNKKKHRFSTLKERDERLKVSLAAYRKTATIEGAGTGAGGIFLGLADFPLLLSIKIKFLFEAAAIYGYDTNQFEERLFILHIFQLAFSSDDHRRETLELLENWENRKSELVDLEWRVFQQEYRDYIDLAKMLQLVPGIGAVVGAYANYNLLEHLGITAMNAYRMRLLETPPIPHN
jgi:hypothetical protein